MSLALFFAKHVSNASTFIFRSLRLCVGILLWFDVCLRYDVASDINWSIFIQLSGLRDIWPEIYPCRWSVGFVFFEVR